MEITYQLTKKQDFFQKNIGTFVKQKITPRVKEIDQAEEFPPEMMADLADNRLLGLLVPKRKAGRGPAFSTSVWPWKASGGYAPPLLLFALFRIWGHGCYQREEPRLRKRSTFRILWRGELFSVMRFLTYSPWIL